MTTVEDEGTQLGPDMVHCKVALFVKPEMVEVARVALAITGQVPEMQVHMPVPKVGTEPASVVEVVHPMSRFDPAKDGDTAEYCVMMTSAVDGNAHVGTDIVHRSTTVPEIPVTVLVGTFGEVIVAIPYTTLHVPVPEAGVLP